MATTEFGTLVSNQAEAATTVSVNYTQGAGNGNRIAVISVMLRDGSTPDVSSLTYGGVAATEAVGIQNVSEDSYSGVWYVLEADLPSNGVISVVVTSTIASTNVLYVVVTMIQDAIQDVPEDTGSQQRSDFSATFGLTTTDGSYQQDSAVNGFTGALTWGTNQVERRDVQIANQRFGVSTKEQPTGGSDTWVVNGSNDKWVYAGASFAGINTVTVNPTSGVATAAAGTPTLAFAAIVHLTARLRDTRLVGAARDLALRIRKRDLSLSSNRRKK